MQVQTQTRHRGSRLVALLAAATGLVLALFGLGHTLDLRAFDAVQASFLPRFEPEAAIVAVDPFTVEQLGWPLSKEIYAGALDALGNAGARSVSFDIFFTDRGAVAQGSEAEREALAAETLLATVAARTRTTLATYVVHIGEVAARIDAATPASARDPNCRVSPDDDAFAKPLLPPLAQTGIGVGHVHTPVSRDGRFREIDGCIPVRDGCIRDLGFVAVSRHGGATPPPCDKHYVPALRSFDAYPVVSLARVILDSETDDGRVRLQKAVRDRDVVVLLTDPTLGDFGATALAPREPLGVIHANRIEALRKDISLRWLNGTAVGAVAFLASAASSLFVAQPVGWLLALAAALALAAIVTIAVFASTLVFVPPSFILLPAVVMMVAMLADSAYRAWKLNRMITDAFGNYVSDDVVSWLKETRGAPLDPDAATTRVVSVMFSDIKGYTRLSNRIDTRAVMRSLRLYLEAMVAIAVKHGGYVDKINGDGMMILFGAPRDDASHAERAVASARCNTSGSPSPVNRS